jgi:hypothetical protein
MNPDDLAEFFGIESEDVIAMKSKMDDNNI